MRTRGMRATTRAIAVAIGGICATGCMFFAEYDDLGPHSVSAAGDAAVIGPDGAVVVEDWCGSADFCDDFERDADVKGSWDDIGEQKGGSLALGSGIGTGRALVVMNGGSLRGSGDAWLQTGSSAEGLAGVRATTLFLADEWPDEDTYVLGIGIADHNAVLVATASGLKVSVNGDTTAITTPVPLHVAVRLRLEVRGTRWTASVLSPFAGTVSGSYPEGTVAKVAVTLGDRIAGHGARWTAKFDRTAVEYLYQSTADAQAE